MREDSEGAARAWPLAVEGDEVAFGVVFTRYADLVYGHCVRRCGDPASAEDLTSLVFLQAWRRRASVPADALAGWLLATANNLLRNHDRTLRRNRSLVARLSVADQVEPDPSDDAVGRLDALRRAHALRDELARLPRRSREVMELVVGDGLSYEQAAAALGVPVGTVRSRLARARGRLAAATGPGDDDAEPVAAAAVQAGATRRAR